MEPVASPGIVQRNLDADTKRALYRAAILLSAAKSENVKGSAFRLLVSKYGFQASNAEIEAEQASLASEALRAIAEIKA